MEHSELAECSPIYEAVELPARFFSSSPARRNTKELSEFADIFRRNNADMISLAREN